MDRDRHHSRPRRGTTIAWILAVTGIAITAALVVAFLGNLPDPPRFDDLRIEPGSSTPVMRGIVRRVHLPDREAPVTEAVDDATIEAWPHAEGGRPAALVVHRVPVERDETTFAVIGLEGADVEVVVRRGRSIVLRTDVANQGGGSFRLESDSIILPDGVSDLEIEMRPIGTSPRCRVWWREVDGEAQPIATLLQAPVEATP